MKSSLGLVWLLSIWAIAGAAAFCATEGPRERDQVLELKDMQKDLAVGLATELRQLRTEKEEDMEPLWSDKVRQYVAKHEQLLLAAVNSGYGETNDGGQLWTFPGCVLFAVSLLTTLGELSASFKFCPVLLLDARLTTMITLCTIHFSLSIRNYV